MYRRVFDRLAAIVGLVIAGVLIAAGGLLSWGHNFVDNQVRTQLAQQQITFPAAGSPQLADPEVAPYLTKYAGQQLVTGAQARAFADHYIAVHINKATQGRTYSQLSSEARANPGDTELAAQVETAFRGETLRGLLLNAYAFSKMGTIALYAAIVSFAGAAVMLLLSALGFRHGRRTDTDAEIFAARHKEVAPAGT